jgi:hypothetical protein
MAERELIAEFPIGECVRWHVEYSALVKGYTDLMWETDSRTSGGTERLYGVKRDDDRDKATH